MQINDIPIYDLYDIWYYPFWYSWWFIALISAILCCILFFVAWYWYQKVKKAKILKEPWHDTLSSLSAFNVALFQEADRQKIFYTQLTEILKYYITRRYAIPLKGKTDQEFLDSVKESNFPEDLYPHLASIMQGAVLIKFAHQSAISEHMRYDLMRSINIIKQTIPHRTT